MGVVLVTVTSEDVCWSIRNVKFINESFYNMRCLVTFITYRSLFVIFTHIVVCYNRFLQCQFLVCNPVKGYLSVRYMILSELFLIFRRRACVKRVR